MTLKNSELACFAAHKSYEKSCINKKCRYWHNLESSSNCIINKVNENKDMTLQEIGELFDITRMRVCQIEKKSLQKLNKLLA
jgi:DNA-directed RNA polymerase sigma subunit (sigma70/sigma32)|tara:strand:- start:22 stop:267 length:246 start_codon:yes stop_codon:yes gene_type:complete